MSYVIQRPLATPSTQIMETMRSSSHCRGRITLVGSSVWQSWALGMPLGKTARWRKSTPATRFSGASRAKRESGPPQRTLPQFEMEMGGM